MTDLVKAYNIGKELALLKFSQDYEEPTDVIKDTDSLTNVLDILASSEATGDVSEANEVLSEGGERNSKSTWGDKLDLEPNSASGTDA